MVSTRQFVPVVVVGLFLVCFAISIAGEPETSTNTAPVLSPEEALRLLAESEKKNPIVTAESFQRLERRVTELERLISKANARADALSKRLTDLVQSKRREVVPQAGSAHGKRKTANSADVKKLESLRRDYINRLKSLAAAKRSLAAGEYDIAHGRKPGGGTIGLLRRNVSEGERLLAQTQSMIAELEIKIAEQLRE